MNGHIYAGDCPDNIQPEARDPSCPACVELERAYRVEVTDEMVERAWRAFDSRAAGGADVIRDESWFEDAIRAALAAALGTEQTGGAS